MNRKILDLLQSRLEMRGIKTDLDQDLRQIFDSVDQALAFAREISEILDIPCQINGSLRTMVDQLDQAYSHRYFSSQWMPGIDSLNQTGWALVDTVNSLEPKAVLDVGCGYHPFRDRIHNILGLDPYNSSADLQIDILHHQVPAGTYDVILALGSLNFNGRQAVETRFAHCVNLLSPRGRFFLRVNPGFTPPAAPYVDVFPWSVKFAKDLAAKYDLELLTSEQENHNRLFFVFGRGSPQWH